MVMIYGGFIDQRLVYDVSDPVNPRLVCSISNTSAHLVNGDLEWLKQISDAETDIVRHSLTGANDDRIGTFPFRVTSGAWLPDGSVMAYSERTPDFTAMTVWLYANQQTVKLYTYPIGIGDCICRFGLPPQVLAVSPDGQYVVSGWESGKGSAPIAVYRVSDHSLATTLDPTVIWAFWDRTGHRLFMNGFSSTTQTWTPETGVADLAGAAMWQFLPGLSPDGSMAAYTAYSVPNTFDQPRVYVYDRKAGATRMLVDKLRTEVLFVKDGWVWYLDERACVAADSCPGSTMPTGKVFAMRLSTGTESLVNFAAGEDPLTQAGDIHRFGFAPGEFWPPT